MPGISSNVICKRRDTRYRWFQWCGVIRVILRLAEFVAHDPRKLTGEELLFINPKGSDPRVLRVALLSDYLQQYYQFQVLNGSLSLDVASANESSIQLGRTSVPREGSKDLVNYEDIVQFSKMMGATP